MREEGGDDFKASCLVNEKEKNTVEALKVDTGRKRRPGGGGQDFVAVRAWASVVSTDRPTGASAASIGSSQITMALIGGTMEIGILV